MTPNLDADRHLPSTRLLCSREIGWRSLLLRTYADPAVAEPFVIPATADLRVVLNTRGRYRLGCRVGGRWLEADYAPGTLGMTAPGEQDELRWHAAEEGERESVHVYLPAASLERFIHENWGAPASRVRMPSSLSATDPVLEHVLRSLRDAVRERAAELYAEAAAQYLIAHLLTRHGAAPGLSERGRLSERQLRRVIGHMRDRLDQPVTLDDLAREAGTSRYHFLRLFKASTGETPLRHLARLRMEAARRLLAQSDLSVTAIAYRCGYENPAHFATAFRRVAGVSPTAWRSATRP